MNSRIYRIQDLDQNERPRERLAEYGPAALSEAELLAIYFAGRGAGGKRYDGRATLVEEF